jgi:hypothetical protein
MYKENVDIGSNEENTYLIEFTSISKWDGLEIKNKKTGEKVKI